MRQALRHIIVTRCSPRECPLCMPDPYAKHNWCLGYPHDPKKIDYRIKTFPKFCPLNKISQKDKVEEGFINIGASKF